MDPLVQLLAEAAAISAIKRFLTAGNVTRGTQVLHQFAHGQGLADIADIAYLAVAGDDAGIISDVVACQDDAVRDHHIGIAGLFHDPMVGGAEATVDHLQMDQQHH